MNAIIFGRIFVEKWRTTTMPLTFLQVSKMPSTSRDDTVITGSQLSSFKLRNERGVYVVEAKVLVPVMMYALSNK